MLARENNSWNVPGSSRVCINSSDLLVFEHLTYRYAPPIQIINMIN